MNEKHTSNIRVTLYYLVQLVLIAAFSYMTYLPTLKIDLFNWGNVSNDGLYLVIVPVYLLPIILILSTAKYFVTKGMTLQSIFKWSFTFPLAIGVICTLLVIFNALFVTVVIAAISAIVLVILLSKKHTNS